MAGRPAVRVWTIVMLMIGTIGAVPLSAQEELPPRPMERPLEMTLEECIGFALSHSPLLRAREDGIEAAMEQLNVARSYYRPQVGFQARYTWLDEARTVDIDNVYPDQVANVFADAAAYFGIARQAGTAAANFALDNPDAPVAPGGATFNSLSAAARDSLPQRINVGLLGQNVLTTQTLAVQPLWTGGKITLRNDLASLGVEAAELDWVKTRQLVIYYVRQSYFAVLLARELEEAAREVAGRARVVERIIESYLNELRLEVHAADLHRAKSVRLLFEEQRAGFERQRARAYAGLKLAMGLDPSVALIITDRRLPRHRERLDWPTVWQLALARHPDLLKSRVGFQAADVEVALARAEFQPDVSLFGGFTTVHDDGGFANPNDRGEWTVGVTAQVPIYTGGRRLAEVRRASWQRSRMMQIQQQVELKVAQTARDAYLQFQEMERRLTWAEQAVASAKKAIRALTAAYRTGSIPNDKIADHFRDRLTTYLLLFAAQTRYNQALFGYHLALARIQMVTVSDDIPENIRVHVSDGGALPEPAGER